MEKIKFNTAYYIKLGQNGQWEVSSISENKLRIGWPNQSLNDINNRNWPIIEKQLLQEIPHKITAKRDFNSLKTIRNSTENDIWITFYSSKLWWCRICVNEVFEDSISKYRKVKDCWHDHDTAGKKLLINNLPGRIAKIQGYRATQCKVKETTELSRLLNNEPSPEYSEVNEAKSILISKVESGLKRLHWKDFETLVDLIFRQSGWRRLTTLGKSMKFVDLELEDPITGDLYQVQVKSQSTLHEFKEYSKQFNKKEYRKLYFVVHSPDISLTQFDWQKKDNVELLLPKRISEMVIDLGLINWLRKKIK
jgi:hypothetical protein